MNEQYQYWKDTICTQISRDPVFLNVLEKFNDSKINVLEIGCARDLNMQARFGDGWSSLFWADYIYKKGGELTSCDIDNYAVENVKKMLDFYDGKIDMKIFVEDGLNLLKVKNDYNLIYLDGSDCPHQMIEQMSYCDLSKSYVLCDDFNQKGILLPEKYPNFILYKIKGTNHQMALFHNTISSLQEIIV
jgi:hypothetical protein